MDIGPVRRRLTAEPVSSPVPGEEWPVEPAPVSEQAAGTTVPTPRPEPAR
ncbi:hypothetical protein [Actinomycetospora aeridis]|uniref:Uncharacterized protein n=1 Tax=Actinomycetospora aeridis TaxID=3129231 RepID=A0ABU8NC60_9PSEU